MGVSFGPFGKGIFAISGAFVVVAVISMMEANVLGGFFLGSLLFLAWAAVLRLAVFAKEADGVIISEHPISSENTDESADDPFAPTVREGPRVLDGANPAQDVESAASRIIGADARRRVMCAQAASVRHSVPSNPKPRESEDRDFADFLRSGPF